MSDKRKLSEEEEKEFLYRIWWGDSEARKSFIESNLGLVKSIAKRYVDYGLLFEDLVQEGCFGLIKAVDLFDPTKKNKFSTYATLLIRQAIKKAIADRGKDRRIPKDVYSDIIEYKKAYVILQKQLGSDASIEEIASYLGWSADKTKELYFLQMDSISIYSLVSDQENNELEKFISDFEESPEDTVISSNLQSDVRTLFERCNLKDKEISVLMERFGFDDYYPKTLKEIALVHHVREETIRQKEAYALYKIREWKGIEEFAIYMDDPEEAIESIEIYRDLYQDSKNRHKSIKISDDMREAKRLEKLKIKS